MPENNQNKWVGIRPADSAEAIPIKQATATNLNITFNILGYNAGTATWLNILVDTTGKITI